MYRALFIIVPGMFLALLAGCSSTSEIPSCCWIAPPDINLTGQKTVIERQIVGEYRELEKEAWVVSSVKTGISSKGGARDEEIFQAFRTRDEARDQVRKFKDEGAVGEANTGLLGYIGTSEYNRDPGKKKALLSVMEKENGARRTIFRRTLVKAGVENPTAEQTAALGRKFAEEQRAFAKVNDWIQEAGGTWVRRK